MGSDAALQAVRTGNAAEAAERGIMGYRDLVFEKDSVFLVTGGAGFIGSNLCEAILEMGYKVRCLDDLSTGKKEHVDMFLDNPDYTFIKGDIKDFDTCMKACEGVDYVLNQAHGAASPEALRCRSFMRIPISSARSI